MVDNVNEYELLILILSDVHMIMNTKLLKII